MPDLTFKTIDCISYLFYVSFFRKKINLLLVLVLIIIISLSQFIPDTVYYHKFRLINAVKFVFYDTSNALTNQNNLNSIEKCSYLYLLFTLHLINSLKHFQHIFKPICMVNVLTN